MPRFRYSISPFRFHANDSVPLRNQLIRKVWLPWARRMRAWLHRNCPRMRHYKVHRHAAQLRHAVGA
jgi:hypothetical protein